MKRFFKDIKKYKNYVGYAAHSELKSEVAGSFLSWLWWFLDPLLYMLVYSFIALLVFGKGEPHFAVFVFTGLNVWQFFSKSVKASVRLIVSNRGIVSRVYMPKHMFVVQKLLVYGFKMFVSFLLTAVFLIIDGVFFEPVHIHLYILWIIPLFALLFIGTFAVCLFVMHFGVFVEDLTNVITVVLQLGFYVSGVFYSLENRLSGQFALLGKILTNCNPLALIMTDMRSVIFGDGSMHVVALAVWTVLSVLVSLIGIKTIYKFENSYVKII